MSSIKNIILPIDEKELLHLKAGDEVLLSGILYTARDAAHKRLIDMLERGEKLPFDVSGQTIYYVGPCPAKPGYVIGTAGPTTSGRMDSYAPKLIELGLKGMIGKGIRDNRVKDAMKKHKAVYFGAIGGAAAVIARTVKSEEIVAFEDLGTEAIRKIEVVNFPVVVVIDCEGNDLYEEGRKRFEE